MPSGALWAHRIRKACTYYVPSTGFIFSDIALYPPPGGGNPPFSYDLPPSAARREDLMSHTYYELAEYKQAPVVYIPLKKPGPFSGRKGEASSSSAA